MQRILHRLPQRHATQARVGLQLGDGGLADATTGPIEDAQQRQLVGGVLTQAQVGQDVFDLGAVVKAHAADDGIRQVLGAQRFF